MPELMRIVLVVGPTSGGIGGHVLAIGRSMVGLGHQVTVVAPEPTAALFDWAAAGMAFAPAPIGAPSPVAVARSVSAVRSAAAAGDVVHAHGVRAGAVSAVAGKTRLVVTWHNGPPARLRRRWAHPLVERLAAHGADVTLAVSPDLAARATRAGARDVRLTAVPAPPSAPETRDRQQVRDELGVGRRPLVVALARLERQKRLDVLVDATAGWTARPDHPVVAVAGTGSLASRLRRQAAAVSSPLVLLGRRADAADLLRAADVVVLPSEWEGYPLVAQEALRLGAPLIATAVGGVPRLVGEAAVLVPPGDPAALRAALEDLLADPDERSRLAEAGVRQARDWPTLEATVIDLLVVYRSLK